VGVVGVFLGANTTNKKKIIRVLGLRTAPVVARDVHGIYDPWDSAPVSVDGVWLGGWYVACGDGGSKNPVMWALPVHRPGAGVLEPPREALWNR
jgi:hypothetical protein